MASPSTLIWRVSVVIAAVVAVPGVLNEHHVPSEVNTDTMLDAAVSLRTISHVRRDAVGDSVWSPGSGSGFLIDASTCEVWTNYHVVADAAAIEVFPRGVGRSVGIPAQLLYASPRDDLAILRLHSCHGMQAARLGDSSTLVPGSETYAVGNPLGSNPDSITRGIVSHTKRFASNGTTPYIQTDAAINPGSSGGALFNARGEVIGINSAIAATRGGGNVGIGYAVPINTARDAASSLRGGTPSWGVAGIEGHVTLLTPDEAELFHVPQGRAAVVVTSAPQVAPADRHFLRRDVIFAVNGQGFSTLDELRRQIAAMPAGALAQFEVVRDGRLTDIDVVLAEGRRPPEAPVAEYFTGYLGMDVEMWADHADERGRFKSPVITHVHNLGPSHKAELVSTQKTVALRGPLSFAYLLDVRAITGIVHDGQYQPLHTVQELEQTVAAAYAVKRPILLEVESWVRPNPRDASGELQHAGTRFFRIMPMPTSKRHNALIDPTEFVGSGQMGRTQEIVFSRWRPRLVSR